MCFVRMIVFHFMFRMYTTNICLTNAFSLTKNILNSICLIMERKMGSWARRTTNWLSQKTIGGCTRTCNSLSEVWIHKRSPLTWAKILYFSFVLDLVTTGWFLYHHETRLGPKYMTSLHVLISYGSSTQSKSLKTFNGICLGMVVELKIT